MQTLRHSVRLDKEKCTGCIHCIQRCPTQAIRVRNGSAIILAERCVDCGECIRVCPHKAKYAERDSMEDISRYRYRVALAAPSLYGQIAHVQDINQILTALKKIGFDDVFEVAAAAERVSSATVRFLREDKQTPRPVISSACPVIGRLISVCFPNLIDNILPIHSPMEEAGRLVREQIRQKTGLPDEDIGVFFITPCPAKVTAIRDSAECEHSSVNGAIAMNDIYPALVGALGKTEPEDIGHAGLIGVSWGMTGGEAAGLLSDHALAADGIGNCMKLLEEIEDEKLQGIEFVELNACTGGCVGGALTAENPFIAKARMQRLRKYLPVSLNKTSEEDANGPLRAEMRLEPVPALRLADNLEEAMKKMNRLNEICATFPALDCGTCGAPTCRALAEDIVRGYTTEQDCIFRIKEEIEGAGLGGTADAFIPPPFRKKKEENR